MKQHLREQVRQKRRSIAEPEKKSMAISVQLRGLKYFQDAETILFYMSKGSEVQTRELIEQCIGVKNIVLPTTHKDQLVLSELKNMKELKKGAYGILEPKTLHEVHPEEIDLAIIPGVVFDRTGARIGYGKGYYDKILGRIKAPKIALAYSSQLVKQLPNEDHDVDVDYIITEEEVIKC